MSLLCISELTKKDISVLFFPDKVTLFDLKDKNTVLGYAERADDELYYIEDNKDEMSVDINGEKGTVRSFMTVATNKEIQKIHQLTQNT